MKKTLILLLLLSTFILSSQNFQLHHDFEREHFTTTFELFKVDKLGNTFTFIDFDYNADAGISGGYFEIARVIQTKKMPVGLHVEYNGGLGVFPADPFNGGFTINNAWIVGANFSRGNAKRGFSTYLGYKAIKDAGEANVQVTGTWYINFLKDKMTFSGFADLWTENGLSDATIFLAEPQIWYHLNKSFSLGGEVEISDNFGGIMEFKVRPTLGLKWNI